MKSFEETVDDCFKPKKPNGYSSCLYDRRKLSPKVVIHNLWVYSQHLNKKYYGRIINEPVIKICKRIIDNPDRFHLVKENREVSKYRMEFEFQYRTYLESFVVVDRDTDQKFIVKQGRIELPTCLSNDESILLSAVFSNWYVDQENKIKQMKIKREEKRKLREQKRKDKFRQELTDLYKDL